MITRLMHQAGFDPESFVAVTGARLVRLALTIIRMPELYLFLLIFVLSWLPGFKPLPFLKTEPGVWMRGVFNGLFLAWTAVFVGFVQRDESYRDLKSQDFSVQGISADGNKHWTIYVLAVLVWLLTYGLEIWTTGKATTWLLLVCAFFQILPLLIGDSLKEQAKHLAPKVAAWILVVTAVWLIAVQ